MISINQRILYALTFLSFVPMVSFAIFEGVEPLGQQLLSLINGVLIALIFGVSLLFFFCGIIQFIRNAGNEKERDEGKRKILYGILALFVMLSIYGIINFLGVVVGIQSGGSAPTLPKIPIQ